MNIAIAEIDVTPDMRAYHATRTVELARAIRAGEPIEPLAVAERDGRCVLVGGRDELAALRLVGATNAPVRVVEETAPRWRGAHLQKRRVR